MIASRLLVPLLLVAFAVLVSARVTPTASPPPSSPTPSTPPPPPPKGCSNPGGGTGPKVCNDPHFVGAHGTRFDFNGLPGEDYCLFTDSLVHINMHMIGYFDERTIGASVLEDGKAVRTWIGKLGIMWKIGGQNHSLVLAAREGGQAERGSGFLAAAVSDRVTLPALQEGESQTLPGGAILTFNEASNAGTFPTDVYTVSVPGLFTLGISLRVAHPLLRTPTDAMAHINVMFTEMHPTAQVHGVMGQTYRDDRNSRTMDYNVLGLLLRRPVAADGSSGKGFLDGKTEDYKTSSVSAPDCRFSSFNSAIL